MLRVAFIDMDEDGVSGFDAGLTAPFILGRQGCEAARRRGLVDA
jgi:hypothetical protein